MGEDGKAVSVWLDWMDDMARERGDDYVRAVAMVCLRKAREERKPRLVWVNPEPPR